MTGFAILAVTRVLLLAEAGTRSATSGGACSRWSSPPGHAGRRLGRGGSRCSQRVLADSRVLVEHAGRQRRPCCSSRSCSWRRASSRPASARGWRASLRRAHRPARAARGRPWPPPAAATRGTDAAACTTHLSADDLDAEEEELEMEKTPRSTSAKATQHHSMMHTRQEAPRGRQPVPADGQRRHDARGALPAPPAGARLGADGARRRRPRGAGGRAARRARGPRPGAVAQAAPRRRQAQHARQQLGQRARPLRVTGSRRP